MPSGPGVRVDTGLEAGDGVPPDYDNLVAKIMVHAGDRGAAIDRLRRALDETEIAGIQTTLPFHRLVARDAGFRAGDLSIDWVAEHWDGPARSSAVGVPRRRYRGRLGLGRAPRRLGRKRPRPARSPSTNAWRAAARVDAVGPVAG